jgi:23S rRNA (guanosine2251-2'-O)-methyltransferase
MTPVSFQIRVCINPDCGLRYPLIKDGSSSDRCPACLGKTDLVIEQSFPKTTPKEESLSKIDFKLHGLVDNIRSALNVGSILRSADGFKFSHLYLCGITPTPDIAGVRKSSLGAEEIVNWSSHKNAVELVTNLKASGYIVWALEKTPNSVEIKTAIQISQKPEKLVLAVGNEIVGVDPGISELADLIVHIQMMGIKSSLNVAVAFAIAAQIVHSWLNENINE